MAVPPGDRNVIWSDGMRTRRSNNSVVVVVFIVIVSAALLAHRTRQITGRNSPEAPASHLHKLRQWSLASDLQTFTPIPSERRVPQIQTSPRTTFTRTSAIPTGPP